MRIQLNDAAVAKSLCQLRSDYLPIHSKLQKELLAPILATKKFARVCGKTWNVPGWQMGELTVRLGVRHNLRAIWLLRSFMLHAPDNLKPSVDSFALGEDLYADFLLYHPELDEKKLIRGTCTIVLYSNALDIFDLDLYRSKD